jgi:hypothetical protein
MSVPTVRVKPWAESQGEFVIINEADFDPAVHTLFDESQVPAVADEAQPEPVQKRKRGAK